ncbi:MAG TPA: ROK family protein [Anaerolineae bacterium]|nr:ROK family protein [Anaerolineae bacterium]
MGRIKGAIREAASSTDWAQVVGIGIGAPGPLNPWTGVIHHAPNLPGWRDVPLRDIIQEEFQMPTFLGNDANVAALAEHRFGAGQGVDDLIYMTVSTGIGGGVIVGGQLLLGADGLAGEVGHMTLEPHGPRCNCGNIGCLEALAAGPAIARDARQRIEEGARTAIVDLVGGDLSQVTAKVVGQAAQEGDELAIELIRRAGFYIGVGIVNLIHLFNPRLFVIGGGVSKVGDLLFDPIRAVVRERAMPAMREVRIVPATLGDDVGLLGAVALAMEAQAANPSRFANLADPCYNFLHDIPTR